MKITDICEASIHFSRLVERASEGEEIVIGKAGKPLVKLVPYRPREEPRQPGQWRGKVKIADDFDELPDDVGRAFEGKHAEPSP